MGTKYTDSDGVEKTVRTPEVENIIEVVSGKKPSNKRALAVEILKYITQQQAASENQSGVDRAVAAMLLEHDVTCLWKHDEPKYGCSRTFHLETVKGQDGVERLVKVKVEKSPTVLEPAPGPMPEFTPAVPLPVLPPSDVETQAIQESSSTFDERYSPGAVAARVAAIEKEAAQMRASRERTE